MELEFRRLLEATLQELGRVSHDLEGRAIDRLSDRELAELYVLWLGMECGPYFAAKRGSDDPQ